MADRTIGQGVGFERTARITGYLVGSLDRFNNAKRQEERDRVKHGVGKPEVGEVSNYVLAKFRPHEQADVKEVVDFGAKACLAYMDKGFSAILQEVNSFRLLRDEKSKPDT